jgi:hypothetical protein
MIEALKEALPRIFGGWEEEPEALGEGMVHVWSGEFSSLLTPGFVSTLRRHHGIHH